MNLLPASNRAVIAALLAAASLTGCADDSKPPTQPPTSTPVSAFDAEFAEDWLAVLTQSIDNENLNPPVASRRIAYTAVAFYEGLVNGMPGSRSLGGQLNGLGALPAPPSGVMHWPSVANAAVGAVLTGLFAGASAPTLDGISNLQAANADVFDDTEPADVITRSIDYGDALAAAILTWAGGDGFALWNNCAYTVPIGDGLWQPTPPAFAPNPLQPCWGRMRTFALLNSAECIPLPPPAYSTVLNSPFYLAALEVHATVEAAVPEEIAIAQFWADGAGTLTPPGHWMSIVRQVSEQQDLSLDVTAEAAARAGIAVADAFIACWEVKYAYNLLRPITYIRAVIDAGFNSVAGIGTPPFPEFTSGHSTQSGAASVVLQDLLGSLAFTDDTHNGTWPARSFTSFVEAADEAVVSRLYGGIHYRFGNQRGLEMGQCVGQTLLDNVRFRD